MYTTLIPQVPETVVGGWGRRPYHPDGTRSSSTRSRIESRNEANKWEYRYWEISVSFRLWIALHHRPQAPAIIAATTITTALQSFPASSLEANAVNVIEAVALGVGVGDVRLQEGRGLRHFSVCLFDV